MAKRALASLLLVVFLLTISASFSCARLSNGGINNLGAAAAEPATVNIVLPSADTATPGRVQSSHMSLHKVALPRRAGKYGPLILNMLPKGRVPPSGPSKGTNAVNN